MEILKQLNYLLDKKTKIGIIVLFLMSIIGSFAELLGITIILPIVELAMDQSSIEENRLAIIIQQVTNATLKEYILLWMIGLTILIYVLKSAYLCFFYGRQFKFAASVKRDLAIRMMKSYLKQPYSFFLQKNSSELIRSVNSDTGHLFQLISNTLTIFSNVLTALCIVVYLSITNFAMTIFVAVVLLVCLLVVIFGIQRKNRKNGYINQQVAGFLIKHLKQAFEGVKEIKIMNIEKQFINIYDETYKKSTDLEVKYSIYNTMPKYIIEVFAISAILGYLGFVILFDPNYIRLIPQLAVFCYAAFKLLPSVNTIYACLNWVIYYKASIDLVYHDIKVAEDLSNEMEEIEANSPDFIFSRDISVKDVSFRYEGTEKDVLHSVNLVIPKGKSVAFVGASGGGKTTMADVVLGLLKPTSGEVCVDGINIRENIGGWRRKLGYIPQTIYLTDDTIRNNIAFGIPRGEIDDAQVWKALEEAQLKEFVESLPKKLDTEVGERGARISGGQRQRIGIARALYRNPEILVFDEATSALDNETEKEVMKAIEGLQGTKTMLMIAHRLSTIENCDVIYKVENGTVERVEIQDIIVREEKMQ